jgi:predicted RNA-binding Zn-ribbon protein involved in translation (DUF1610 family)
MEIQTRGYRSYGRTDRRKENAMASPMGTVNAREVPLKDAQAEQAARARVKGGLGINVEPADTAYECGNCGNVIAFAHKGNRNVIQGGRIDCPACGAANAMPN